MERRGFIKFCAASVAALKGGEVAADARVQRLDQVGQTGGGVGDQPGGAAQIRALRAGHRQARLRSSV